MTIQEMMCRDCRCNVCINKRECECYECEECNEENDFWGYQVGEMCTEYEEYVEY